MIRIWHTLLLLGFALCSCGKTSSIDKNKDIFTINLNANEQSYTFVNTSGNNVSVNELDIQYFTIHIPFQIWTNGEDNTDKISFSYNEELISIDYSFTLDKQRTLTYKLRTLDVFEQEKIDITFLDSTYEINLASLKHNFSAESKVDSITLNNSFPEFKEMLDSIQLHEYMTPYVGLQNYGSAYQEEFIYRVSFEEGYNLDYLSYLKDDVYYPTKFDLAFPNIAVREMNMILDDANALKVNSEKTTMARFEVSLGVIDPDCTNPTNPLHGLVFIAVPLNHVSPCESINKSNRNLLADTKYLLSKKYSNEFSSYVVGDITIRLLKSGNSLYGFFEDETYSYRVQCFYDK